MTATHTAAAAAAAAAVASTSAASAVDQSAAYKDLRFKDTLEDLSSRFIVNLPAEELASIERICFQVEQAHWFYEDFLRPLNPSLPSLSLRRFTLQLLLTASHTVPLIRRYISKKGGGNDYQELEEAFEEFLRYKHRVPVCGAVMLNEQCDKCVLVRAWKGNSWGFPKGKINQSEPERDCAIREVYEETGYDCSALLPPDSPDFMDLTMRGHKIRIYIVPGVPESTKFETLTRKEISKIDWFKLSELPTWKSAKANSSSGKFYLISPFVERLKQWLAKNKPQAHKNIKRAAEAAATPAPTTADLKAALGITSGSVPALMGEELYEEERRSTPRYAAQAPIAANGAQNQEELRSQALLDLLRGAAEPALSAGPSQPTPWTQQQPQHPNPAPYQNGSWERGYEPDERERGAASLLAALRAGAGEQNAPQANAAPPRPDDNSASLLALLSGPSQPPPQPPQQLPNPPNQSSSQVQHPTSASLLSLLNGPSRDSVPSPSIQQVPSNHPPPVHYAQRNGVPAPLSHAPPSPMPAPQAQNNALQQSLLSMLSKPASAGASTPVGVTSAKVQDGVPPPPRSSLPPVQVVANTSSLPPPLTSPGGSSMTEEERKRKRDALLASMMTGASLNPSSAWSPDPVGGTASLSPVLQQVPGTSSAMLLQQSPSSERNRSQRLREAQERDRALNFKFPPPNSGETAEDVGEQARPAARTPDARAGMLLSMLNGPPPGSVQQAALPPQPPTRAHYPGMPNGAPSVPFAPFGAEHGQDAYPRNVPPVAAPQASAPQSRPAPPSAPSQAGSLLSLLNSPAAAPPVAPPPPTRPPNGNAASLLSMLNAPGPAPPAAPPAHGFPSQYGAHPAFPQTSTPAAPGDPHARSLLAQLQGGAGGRSAWGTVPM